MTNLIDFVIALFRDDALARAFASDPRQALASAGLEDADVNQLGAVAATAFPEIALNEGDHALELQRAVAQHVGVDTIIPLSGDPGGSRRHRTVVRQRKSPQPPNRYRSQSQ